MERKEKMSILDKKEFYKMALRDRFPIARIEFFADEKEGAVDFYRTPLGTVLKASLEGFSELREIKMYDRKRGGFALQNVFCGDNLVGMGDGTFVSVSNKIQVEDVIGREFLIKTDSDSIVARAQMLPKRERKVDKLPHLVYN